MVAHLVQSPIETHHRGRQWRYHDSCQQEASKAPRFRGPGSETDPGKGALGVAVRLGTGLESREGSILCDTRVNQ